MTVLIVGGASQGKTAFAKSIALEQNIVDDLHELVRNAMKNGMDVPKAEAFEDMTVVCNELGCGIVPMDAFEREWREAVGRLCCDIAKRADKVYRVCCGIPQCIKEEAWN